MIVAVVSLATLIKLWAVWLGIVLVGCGVGIVFANPIPQPSHVKSGVIAVGGTALALILLFILSGR